jgi:hypothetical protein
MVFHVMDSLLCHHNLGIGELEIAKRLLFQAVQQASHCPQSLFVMCALGLLQRDGALAAAALGLSLTWMVLADSHS